MHTGTNAVSDEDNKVFSTDAFLWAVDHDTGTLCGLGMRTLLVFVSQAAK